MNLQEIKHAVDAGKIVHWGNVGYRVTKDSLGQYQIVFIPNNNTIGLTHHDGVTLNGKEEDFFIKE